MYVEGLHKLEEDIKSSGAEVIESCEPPDPGAENGTLKEQ